MSTGSHISDVLWLAISAIFLFVFSHLGGSDTMEQKALPTDIDILGKFKATQSLTDLGSKPISFTTLAKELQFLILSHASTDIKSARQTFLALVLVSKDIRRKMFLACLPHMSIMLTTRERLISFDLFCSSNPEDAEFPGVALLVNRLWISPFEPENQVLSSTVLKRCVNVRSLACNAWLLKEAVICSPDELKHKHCQSLTLLTSEREWEGTLPSQMRHGPCKAFFSQLTHLQVAGDSMLPKQLLCSSLTHLSFACPPGWKNDGAKGLSVKSLTKRYPEFKTIAMTQRKEGEARAEMVAKLGNSRVVVYYSPKEAIEADEWSEGVSVWDKADEALRWE
ncbi:hypothetical protein F5887DRAFT_986443 [Amanita rubescens]|nr:hypothetical protein F5887DRAFT_986443 [Amanita rubescens]